MVQYIEDLVKDGMSHWRAIDSMIVSKIIQEVQKEIKKGNPKILDWLHLLGPTVAERKEKFNAWRIFMIDRMMAEYDKGLFTKGNPFNELYEDLEYYKALLHKDKSQE